MELELASCTKHTANMNAIRSIENWHKESDDSSTSTRSDCSEYVLFIYDNINIEIDSGTSEQFYFGVQSLLFETPDNGRMAIDSRAPANYFEFQATLKNEMKLNVHGEAGI